MVMFSCTECGSTDLVIYREEVKAYEQKITPKGSVTRRKLVAHETLIPDHVSCKVCGARYDYDLSDDGIITKLI